MKKIMMIGVLAGLTLVAAAPPSHWRTGSDREWTGSGYPPCSRTVTDRCIQLYERGVATAANLALNERLGPDRPGVGLAAALPAPEPVAEDYAVADPYESVGEDWQQEEEFAAWYPEDEYRPDDEYLSGM